MSLFNLQYHIFFNSFSYDLHTYLKVVFDPIESYYSMNWQSWWFLVLIRNYRNRARSSYVHAQRLSDYIISYSVVLSRIMANRACSCHEHDIISYFEVLLARVPNFARVKATTSTDVSQCGNYRIFALAQFLSHARLSILLKFCACVSDKNYPTFFCIARAYYWSFARACQTRTIPLCFVLFRDLVDPHARPNLMSLCDRPEI